MVRAECIDREGLGRRRLGTGKNWLGKQKLDRVSGLVSQSWSTLPPHNYRITLITSKILCLLNERESSDMGSEYYVSKLRRFHKIVTSQARNKDRFSHCYALTKADSYHTGHLGITKSYGNPRQLPEKGPKNASNIDHWVASSTWMENSLKKFYFSTSNDMRQWFPKITIILGANEKKRSSSVVQSAGGQWGSQHKHKVKLRICYCNSKIMQIFSL